VRVPQILFERLIRRELVCGVVLRVDDDDVLHASLDQRERREVLGEAAVVHRYFLRRVP
jgi:hypothetical protein